MFEGHPLGDLVDIPEKDDIGKIIRVPKTSEFKKFPKNQYANLRFAESLFPRRNKIVETIYDLMKPEAAMQLREQTQKSYEECLSILAAGHKYQFRCDQQPRRVQFQKGPVRPIIYQGIYPVLYQGVARVGGNTLLLECKDAFVFAAGRRDLRFIFLDKHSLNIADNRIGLDEEELIPKSLFWVYALEMDPSNERRTVAQIEETDRQIQADLGGFPSRFTKSLWRVGKYAPILGEVPQERLGYVLKMRTLDKSKNPDFQEGNTQSGRDRNTGSRRGGPSGSSSGQRRAWTNSAQRPYPGDRHAPEDRREPEGRRGPGADKNKKKSDVYMAVEGCTSVGRYSVKALEAARKIKREDDLVMLKVLGDIPTPARFSVMPRSVEALERLLEEVRGLVSPFIGDVLTPVDVVPLPRWIRPLVRDMDGDFESLPEESRRGYTRVCELYRIAAASLAAEVSFRDDRQPHEVTISTKNLNAIPLSVDFTIEKMPSSKNWEKERTFALMVEGTAATPPAWALGKIFSSELIQETGPAETPASESRQVKDKTSAPEITFSLKVKGQFWDAGDIREAFRASNGKLKAKVQLQAEENEMAKQYCDLTQGSPFDKLAPEDMASQCISDLFTRTGQRVRPTASYNSTDVIKMNDGSQPIRLTAEQKGACDLILSPSNRMIATEAVPGSGKTLVMSVAMARRALTPGSGVVVGTAVTNAAIHQLTNNLSKLEMTEDIPIVRFVADRARKSMPRHPYDLSEVLRRLLTHPEVQAKPAWKKTLTRFIDGRTDIDSYDTTPDAADKAF